jgi:protein TonB
MARDSGFEGSVDMKILINENGKVESVKIQKSSNSIILDKAAVEYTKLIKFKPALRDSQYISVWSTWKVIFDLVPSDTSYSEVVFKTINE